MKLKMKLILLKFDFYLQRKKKNNFLINKCNLYFSKFKFFFFIFFKFLHITYIG